ncbi:MAG: phosphosulfolactate synthase [Bacteroidota bacterium]|nr:phosphosulfolactate synthase [Bacteroidota bacterium]
MNFTLNNLPERTLKPRSNGITMVMDKGLSLREAENFADVSAEYVDIVKLGFGTAFFTPNLAEKIKVYQNAGLQVYFGGTLLEAFVVRGQFDDFISQLDKYKINYVEVSDGSIHIEHDEKCTMISRLAKNYKVLSEVGSKDAEVVFAPYKWIEQMQTELDAGSSMVVAEAREGGNVGIFRGTGEVRSGLVDEILTKIPSEKILWEAPNKSQQVWFIKLLGSNVNLGNIPVAEAIPLETLRMGLRGDTFFQFLPKEMKAKFTQLKNADGEND